MLSNDGHAYNAAYPHDGCADKDSNFAYLGLYRCVLSKLKAQYANLFTPTHLAYFYAFGLQITHYESQLQNYAHEMSRFFYKFSSILMFSSAMAQ